MDSVICKNDKQVLQMIINPNLPLSGDDEAEASQDYDTVTDETFDQIKLAEVKRLEKEGVTFAETGNTEEAMKCFDQAITMLPQRASGYNNRAQARRISGDIDGALEDLNAAITLTNGEGKVASLAFTQRGLIMKLNGDTSAAESDFKQAAKLGSKFAKQELIQSNPYAALCNKMLGQVMQGLKTGAPQNE
uniref:Tetratricopeptide repeat protein 36 n=1 Tax=Phallusia mammillata TaxID=59560 RepID=A0A6F9DWF7_9ASCI|nr:tetratricopeptide repeat protein 36-like [Phallusia mammillata]